jgi:mono/diheme cytochrome c family protein
MPFDFAMFLSLLGSGLHISSETISTGGEFVANRCIITMLNIRGTSMTRTSLLIALVVSAWPVAAQNPVAYSAESIARGGQIYKLHCPACHGADGRAQMDVISDATDLTEPEAYYNGTSEQDMFISIRDGAGVGMPPWTMQLKDEADMWRLVNFIRSLWTQEQRDNF